MAPLAFSIASRFSVFTSATGTPPWNFSAFMARSANRDAGLPAQVATHIGFRLAQSAFGDGLPVVMTEKDAVKCSTFATDRCWYLPVEARLDPALVTRVEERLRGSQAA